MKGDLTFLTYSRLLLDSLLFENHKDCTPREAIGRQKHQKLFEESDHRPRAEQSRISFRVNQPAAQEPHLTDDLEGPDNIDGVNVMNGGLRESVRFLDDEKG